MLCRKMKTMLSSLTVIILFTGMPCNAAEPDKSVDQIKFRQSAMMFMRWNIGRIKQQLAVVPARFRQDEVIAAARVIAAISDSGFENLFSESTREGTGWKPTRLKPVFFTQPELAQERITTFKKEAASLLLAANEGDVTQLRTQFDRTFASCQACHKAFRE